MIVSLILILTRLLTLLVIVDVMLSYFLSPYHPIRETLDRIVQPMLDPIRKIIPSIQMIDFSPVILILLIQLVQMILVQIF
ncbi:MAG: YggT family protein [Anaerolineaceae bacterium]|nr:YggT family protein [Anaerolineaceae bacterium]